MTSHGSYSLRGDAYVSYGHHFGRTVTSMCAVTMLITNALVRVPKLATKSLSEFPHQAFEALLAMIPGLEDLVYVDDDKSVLELEYAANQARAARSEDGMGIREAIVNWLTPPGVALIPPIPPYSKIERGFNHPITGRLLCPAVLDWDDPSVQDDLKALRTHPTGDHWPVLVYENHTYTPGDVWKGLFHGPLLVKAYKHVFTSPSSAIGDSKSKKGSNAGKHRMNRVTRASIVYIATLTRFSLQNVAVFSRTDKVADSQRFYTSMTEMLDDPDFMDEVVELVAWWNK
ncbi:hypothetical protein OF83DRAFT_1069090 [Amylostereum chailletii]|nr:hypothetical protein OF83DRAFT_1069090 [Amylostereum chailletii]